MYFYKIIVAYDGTDYAGWQVQPNQKAIANVLKNTFKTVFKKEVAIIGASRTDAGVHALGQVARLATDIAISAGTLKNALNNKLPPDILIRSLKSVKADFHPQANVSQKIYWYHIFIERPLPFVQRFGFFYQYPLDMHRLSEAVHVFVGTHNFRSFCRGHEREDTVRTIDSISLRYLSQYKAIQIEVRGERFLHFMIRRIIGACLEVASRRDIPISILNDTLAAQDPNHALPNAPAKGLMLRKIIYRL